MGRGRPINVNGFRDKSPCAGCPERFTSCSDRCTKDDRGEYGYTAWKQETAEVKDKRKVYMENRGRRYKHG